MSSKNKSKCKNKCPSCRTPKDNTVLKQWENTAKNTKNQILIGMATSMKSRCQRGKTRAPGPGDKQDALLQVIRALSSQVQALQLKQQTLRGSVAKLRIKFFHLERTATSIYIGISSDWHKDVVILFPTSS